MEKLEEKVMLLIEHAEEVDQKSKSLKIPDKMMHPNHLELGSFKVDNELHPSCPKCNHTLLNQPKETKAIAKSNNNLHAEYKKDKKKLETIFFLAALNSRRIGRILVRLILPS
jgi:hypothetical protein